MRCVVWTAISHSHIKYQITTFESHWCIIKTDDLYCIIVDILLAASLVRASLYISGPHTVQFTLPVLDTHGGIENN